MDSGTTQSLFLPTLWAPARASSYESESWAPGGATLCAVASGFVALVPAVIADDYAYTWSLLAFAIPLAVMSQWLRHHAPLAWDQLVAYGPATLAVLVPMGFALNLALADVLFVYPEPRAILGVQISAIAGAGLAVPIEEYLFYVLGFSFILVGYVFFTRNAMTHRTERVHSHAPRAPRRIAGWVVVSALLTLGVALGLRPNESVDAPVYLYYLVSLPVVLTLLCAARAWRTIHWPGLARITAFTFALSFVLEGMLALPRGWWGYNPSMMCGLDVTPGLPIEAVLVWWLAAVATCTVFEVLCGGGAGDRSDRSSPRDGKTPVLGG
jgi:hypothetical protein